MAAEYINHSATWAGGLTDHDYKLIKQPCHVDIRKYFLSINY